jgi:hypothetical protein
VIILEGPDGSGKSTLAAELGGARHEGPPGDTDLFRHYQRKLQEEAYVVHDRLFHGELVYGPVMRGRSRLTPYQARYLEYQAATYGCLVVWCDADSEVLPKRGDPIYQTVLASELRARYEEVRRWSRLRSHYYRSDVEKVAATAKLVNAAANPRDWPHCGVGGQAPLAVLVGEAWPGRWPAPDDPAWEQHRHMRPFDASPSGRFLLAALERTNLGPQELYITNARKQWTRRSVATLRAELDALIGEPPLVVLGKEAQREVRVAGLMNRVVAVLDHPQYLSRFHHEKQEEYAVKLDNAIKGRL